MSLATLNKKSKVLYHSMSVNRPQFSLNGYYRNDRSLPSTNRTQTSIPRTLARGNQLRGHGGNNGNFKITTITALCEQPQAEQTENKTIKLSTKNTKGLIATKYLWTKLPNPYTWVKRQNNSSNTSCQLFTENLSKQAIKTIISTNNKNPIILNGCNLTKKSSIFSKNSTNFTKDQNTFTSTSQNEYIAGLGGNCVNNIVNTVYSLPTNLSGVPILGKI
jgi:hypothetical protein